MDNNTNSEKAKEAFSSFWKKTADISKKAAEGAKAFAEQTKKNIHEAQAKKYTPVTAKEFKSKSFDIPNIINIVDDSANRNFVTSEDAIGWVEKHEGIDVLHMYSGFVKKSNLLFIAVPEINNVYCKYSFEDNKYINANDVFEKATNEKVAELEHIAFCLGAKSCYVEIVEADGESCTNSTGVNVKGVGSVGAVSQSVSGKMQSGKTDTLFEGHDNPTKPTLKWFKHDDSINKLIEMRCGDKNSIKMKILELKGSSSAAMSKNVACAIDNVMNSKGTASMESKAIKEHNKILRFEIEF